MMNVNVLSPQMKINVESILNPTISDAYATHNGVSSNIKITKKPKATCYHIDVEFHNLVKTNLTLGDNNTIKSDGDTFSFTPFILNSIRIEQQFSENYLNHYELNVALTPDQYQLLYYNYKDLRCTVRFYGMDVNTKTIYGKTTNGDPLLVIEDAYCIFKDKQDMLKGTPKSMVMPESDTAKNTNNTDAFVDVSFQLIPKEDYKFRVTKCNMILNNSTVADAILMIANSSECVDALMMVTPDNQTKYKNIVIPPILSLADALKFLQDHYGVYSKGMGYYYQVGCLYVYPLYETDPVLPKDKAPDNDLVYKKNIYASVTGSVMLDEMGDGGMTHIYMVGNDNYVGLQYYHAYEGNTIHIVSNSLSVFRDLADTGMENVGYGYIVHHSDRDIDVCRNILEADSTEQATYGIWPIDIHQNPNNSYMAFDGQNRHIGITSTQANVQYVDDKSNMYTIQSSIYSYLRTVAGFEWNNAVPFTFRPGYRIYYHYDGEDQTRRKLTNSTGSSLQYMTKSGVVDEVTYTFTTVSTNPPVWKNGNMEQENVYTCKAQIGVSLEVDLTNHIDGIA